MRERRVELRELREQVGLALHFAGRLAEHLAALDGELEGAQSAADAAARDEHARQAFWLCQVVASDADGLGEDAEDVAAALLEAFAAPDPRRHRDSRWWSPRDGRPSPAPAIRR